MKKNIKLQNRECPVCKKEILITDRHFMVALEVPYLNIFFHKECYESVKDNINEFLKTLFPNIE